MGEETTPKIIFEYLFEDGSAVRVFKYGAPSTDDILWVLGELMDQKKRELARAKTLDIPPA